MALPPESLDEVLPVARQIVLARVVDVVDLGPWRGAGPGIDAAPDRPPQRVHLAVVETLRGGSVTTALWAHKPAANYALMPGAHGPFLLDDAPEPRILGRYGPDTWSEEQVRHALKEEAR